MLVEPKFHQTIESGLVGEIYICSELFADEILSFEFIEGDSDATAKKLEMVVSDRFGVRYCMTRTSGTAGTADTAGTTCAASTTSDHKIYSLSCDREERVERAVYRLLKSFKR